MSVGVIGGGDIRMSHEIFELCRAHSSASHTSAVGMPELMGRNMRQFFFEYPVVFNHGILQSMFLMECNTWHSTFLITARAAERSDSFQEQPQTILAAYRITEENAGIVHSSIIGPVYFSLPQLPCILTMQERRQPHRASTSTERVSALSRNDLSYG